VVPPRRLAEAGMRRAVAEPRGTCGMITKPLLVSDRLYTSVLWALVMALVSGSWSGLVCRVRLYFQCVFATASFCVHTQVR